MKSITIIFFVSIQRETDIKRGLEITANKGNRHLLLFKHAPM